MVTHQIVSSIGLLCQLGGVGLLALLFFLLRRQARRGRYLLAWTWSWFFLLASLAATGLRIGLFPITGPRAPGVVEPLVSQLLTFLSLWGQLGHALLLLSGAAAFVRGSRLVRCFALGLPAAGFYALLGLLAAQGPHRMVYLQGPALIVLYTAAAGLLARRLLAHRSFGVSLAFVSLASHSVFLAVYSLSFLVGTSTGAHPQGLFMILASYGSFFDLLLQVLLGLGMVLIVSEEARRELDAAYGQLEIAYDELQRDSNIDRLTGCYNRRAFEERVALEGLKEVFGSIAVIDLDNLKEVNDRLGHEAGDQLLRHLVQSLRRRLRPQDRIFRLGGDEFAIVLERARLEEARERMSAIFRTLPKLSLEGTWPGTAELTLEVSLGMAEFERLDGLSNALRRADRRMYDDKRRRKGLDDAVTPREELPHSGNEAILPVDLPAED